MARPLSLYLQWLPHYLRQRFMPLSSLAPRRLHLGCGSRRAEGWVNLDIRFTRATDFLDDLRHLRRVPAAWADEIYACHVLEHFDFVETQAVLRQWTRVLRPGGILRVSVPDMDRITSQYQRHLQHFHTPGNEPWTGLIYGGQTDRYDFHKNGFNFTSLKHHLEALGFEEVREYPHEPHFIVGLEDASLANAPFGEMLSLNVMARRKSE